MSGDTSPTGPKADRSIDISFAVACYNAGEYLEPAIRSALAQERVGLEVLVVDDGSSDGSREVAHRLAGEDDRVVPLRTPRNSGPAGARNVALDAMRGRWYAILDADDLILPDRSRRLLALAEKYSADMVADNLIQFGDGITEKTMFDLAPCGADRVLNLHRYFVDSRLFGPNPSPGYLKPMIRREAVERAGLRYNEDLKIGEDDELVIRALAADLKYAVCDYAGYRYRKHNQSISHRLSLEHLERMVAAEGTIEALLPDTARQTRAYQARKAALQRAAAFTRSIEALKQAAPLKAAMEIARHPSALGLYAMPIKARLQRMLAFR
jgi:succinoglycan biosynthesis protein ExoO